MKLLLIASLLLTIAFASHAQDTPTPCDYDSTFYNRDEILMKINGQNSNVFTQRYRVMDEKTTRYIVNEPQSELISVWVTISTLAGQEKELVGTTDFMFDCNSREVVFFHPELFIEGSILKIHCMYR